jgi:hypothetical protein
MVLSNDTFDRRRKLLEESRVLIERLKKLRALNADPKLVGIDPRLQRTPGRFFIVETEGI